MLVRVWPSMQSNESRYKTIATTFYATGANLLTTKQLDLTTDTIKAALFTSAHNSSVTDSSYTALTNESAGAGYTAGGKALANKAWIDVPSKRQRIFDADDVTWTATTLAFRYIVLYADNLPNKPVVAVIDMNQSQTATNQDLTVRWQYQTIDPETNEISLSSGVLAVGY